MTPGLRLPEALGRGVGRGTLYRHFSDRTELALAVLEADVADLLEFLAQLFGPAQRP